MKLGLGKNKKQHPNFKKSKIKKGDKNTITKDSDDLEIYEWVKYYSNVDKVFINMEEKNEYIQECMLQILENKRKDEWEKKANNFWIFIVMRNIYAKMYKQNIKNKEIVYIEEIGYEI